MNHQSLLTTARRHPSVTFGLIGGLFAVAFVAATSTGQLPVGDGHYPPSFLELVIVVGGFLGGALVARLLWNHFNASRSTRRGALVGALIGLLALAAPMYLLEIGVVLVEGNPVEPRPGSAWWMQVIETVFVLIATPMALGALAIIPTRGGTILLGAIVGFLLARD